MSNTSVHAVDTEGNQILGELLAPMFASLGPGLADAAEELRLEADHSARPQFDVRSGYFRGGAYFPLPVHPEFHPWVTSSRIRILCGMSIRPDVPEQSGSMRISVDGKVITVAVRITFAGRREVVSFRPMWEAPSTTDKRVELTATETKNPGTDLRLIYRKVSR